MSCVIAYKWKEHGFTGNCPQPGATWKIFNHTVGRTVRMVKKQMMMTCKELLKDFWVSEMTVTPHCEQHSLQSCRA